MKRLRGRPRVLVLGICLAAVITAKVGAQRLEIAGAPCSSPPPLHCPDADCSNELVAYHGTPALPKSKRAFFLDYPCDLKPGEAVTFILSLHGGGMIGP